MADVCHTHEYLVADDLPLAVGIVVEDGEAAAGVSEDQFGPWESRRRGRLRMSGRGVEGREPSFAWGKKANLLTDWQPPPHFPNDNMMRFPINQMSPLQVTHNPSLFVTKAVIL